MAKATSPGLTSECGCDRIVEIEGNRRSLTVMLGLRSRIHMDIDVVDPALSVLLSWRTLYLGQWGQAV